MTRTSRSIAILGVAAVVLFGTCEQVALGGAPAPTRPIPLTAAKAASHFLCLQIHVSTSFFLVPTASGVLSSGKVENRMPTM